MGTRVGINGFGRIGRDVLRAALGRDAVEIVAVNDVTDARTLAHLLKYDSVGGIVDGDVRAKDGALTVNGHAITVLAERDPAKLPLSHHGAYRPINAADGKHAHECAMQPRAMVWRAGCTSVQTRHWHSSCLV